MESIKLTIPDFIPKTKRHGRVASEEKLAAKNNESDNNNDNFDEEEDCDYDDDDDEEDENMKLIIIYNGKARIKTRKDIFIMKLKYFRANVCKMNQIINSKIIYIEDKFLNKNFRGFISALKRKEIIMNDSNCYEYFEMSEKYGFEEMYGEIKKFIEERPDIKRMIESLQPKNRNENSGGRVNGENEESNKNDDSENKKLEEDNSLKEEIIAKNLDLCIQSGLLSNLRIATLNRIFKSPHRQLKDHHLLYEFIMNTMNSNPNKKNIEYASNEIQILISSLDYSKMTKKDIKGLIENENFQKKIQPENAEKRIGNLIEKNNRMKIEIIKMKEKMEELNEKMEKVTNEIKKGHEEDEERVIKEKNEIYNYINNLMAQNNKNLEEIHEKQEIIVEEQKLQKEENEKGRKETKEKEQIEKKAIQMKMEEMKETGMRIENNIGILKQKIEFIQKAAFKKYYLGNKFVGIFHELNQTCQGNMFEKGIIEVTGNQFDENYKFSFLFGSNKNYLSKPENNSYLCFNFKDHSVAISSYSIKSSVASSPDHIRSWKVEGWNEKEGWIELDSHSNDVILYEGQNEGKEVHFEIKEEEKKNIIFKKIQLQITGKSSQNRYYLEISQIEFFGCYF